MDDLRGQLDDLQEKVQELNNDNAYWRKKFDDLVAYSQERELKWKQQIAGIMGSLTYLYEIAKQQIPSLPMPSLSDLSPFKKPRLSYHSPEKK